MINLYIFTVTSSEGEVEHPEVQLMNNNVIPNTRDIDVTMVTVLTLSRFDVFIQSVSILKF